ncbi:MAG: hypothetical protein R3F47_19995 [Gammaproteobacteria bacterium]
MTTKLIKDFADSTHLTKNAFGFIGFAGWAFHGGYSLEVSYADFGEFEADALFGNLDESLAGSMTAKGFGMRYDWYEMDAMSVYGRIGVMRWETTWDVDIVNLDTSTTERISSNTNGSEFYVGLGGQYELMKTSTLMLKLSISMQNTIRMALVPNSQFMPYLGG